MQQQKKKVIAIADRREAIKTAVSLAQKEDIVLIAGKGHEKYQDIKGVKYDFDDKKVLCLDAKNVVTFGLTGDGKLIDNMGTASGSRVVELQNGRAIIRLHVNGGKSIASVKCTGIPTVFCELK